MLSASSGPSNSEMLSISHHQIHMKNQTSPSSSRILDIPCKVCGDFSSGKHYNIFACDGCAGFFKRSIRRNRVYVCKAKEGGNCLIDKPHRNQCRACRLQKCQEAGMNKDAVQHERGPRNSTLKRQQQMSQYYQEEVGRGGMLGVGNTHQGVLNLSIARPGSASPRLDPPPVGFHHPVIPPPTMFAPFLPILPHLPPTPPGLLIPANLSPAVICETAARLLFINVQWARSLPALAMLPMTDQLLLLEESWQELFILAASRCMDGVSISSLFQASGLGDKDGFLQDVREFQETLSKLNQLQLDPHEFVCIRTIILFKTNFGRSSDKKLEDPARVSLIQDESQLNLSKYERTAYPTQPLRFGKILMFLPSLRAVSAGTIEDLFFRKAIDNIPIVKIICDMYKSSSSGGRM